MLESSFDDEIEMTPMGVDDVTSSSDVTAYPQNNDTKSFSKIGDTRPYKTRNGDSTIDASESKHSNNSHGVISSNDDFTSSRVNSNTAMESHRSPRIYTPTLAYSRTSPDSITPHSAVATTNVANTPGYDNSLRRTSSHATARNDELTIPIVNVTTPTDVTSQFGNTTPTDARTLTPTHSTTPTPNNTTSPTDVQGLTHTTSSTDVTSADTYSKATPGHDVTRPTPELAYSACFRCGLRVYPVEKVDVGLLFHRRCFRCKVCNLQLTLRTFCLDREDTSEIYCQIHTPRLVGTINQDAVGIRSVLNTPRRPGYRNEQIRGSGGPGWEYDAHALEFEHQKGLGSRKPQRPNIATYKHFEESGVYEAQTELERVQKEEEDRLYEMIDSDRRQEIERVETELGLEVGREVREPGVDNGSDNDAEESRDTLLEERDKRVNTLMRRMSVNERQKVSDLIEKHSQEMLVMIAEKLTVTQETDDEGDDFHVSDVILTSLPEVAPPEFKRKSLFNSPRIFEDIDRRVCQIAQNEYSTFTCLVMDLIRDCLSDLEKVRAIFLWITLKDLNALEISEAIAADSPYGLLRGIQYGTESYHHLFKRLCSYAGLFCEVIQGYSKATGYKPGMMALNGDHFRNSWTAVSIDGSWQFINCNWGARHVKGHNDPESQLGSDPVSQLHYRFDEFYFITDPEDHIFQHYPNSPDWQLLECPITASDFIDLPVVKSPFFNLGMRFSQYYECNLYTDGGFVEVILTVPRSVIFGHTLVCIDDVTPIYGRVLLRIVGDKAIFTVAPPTLGYYYFTIFSKLEVNASLQSACSFRITCDSSLPESSCFPNVSVFGPVASTHKFIPIPITYKDPLITTLGEDLQLDFSLLQRFKICHSFHLFTNNNEKSYTFDDMANFSFLEYADDEKLTFLLRFPKAGFYIFSLNAAPMTSVTTSTHTTYECVYRYLIKCDNPLPSYPDRLPRACHRWYGCRLIQPYNGNISRNQNVSFKLDAPTACDVAVMVGPTWFHLQYTHGIWQGHVFSGHQHSKAKVYAKLDSLKARYSPLLEFVVQ